MARVTHLGVHQPRQPGSFQGYGSNPFASVPPFPTPAPGADKELMPLRSIVTAPLQTGGVKTFTITLVSVGVSLKARTWVQVVYL